MRSLLSQPVRRLAVMYGCIMLVGCGRDVSKIFHRGSSELSPHAYRYSWETNYRVNLNSLLAEPDGALWGVGPSGYLAKSVDGGKSWVQQSVATDSDLNTISGSSDGSEIW